MCRYVNNYVLFMKASPRSWTLLSGCTRPHPDNAAVVQRNRDECHRDLLISVLEIEQSRSRRLKGRGWGGGRWRRA